MADVIARLKVDSKEYDSKIQRATAGLLAFEKECQSAGKSMADASKEQVEFAKSLGQMDTVANSSTQKLGELKKAFTELNVQYQNMTKAEKNSDYGKALKGSLDQLKGRIGDLNGQIGKAKGDMSSFGDALKGLGEKAGLPIGQLMKMGPAAAAAAVAIKVATDAFKQNELLMDEWGRETESAKSIYSGFLNALNTGDFSSFFTSMGKIVSSARAAYDALDALGTFNAFNQIQSEAARTNFTEAMANYREGSGSREDVKKAGEELKKVLQDRKDKEQDAYIAAIQNLASERGVDEKLLERVLKGDYGSYDQIKRLTQTNASTGGRGRRGRTSSNSSNSEIMKLSEMLNKLSDEDLKRIQGLGAQAQRTATEVAQVDKQMAKVLKEDDKKKPVKVPVEPELPEGSIAKLRKQLSEAQKAFEMAGDDASREVAKKRIEEITAEIEKLTGKAKEAEQQLEETFEVGSLKDLQRQLKDAQDKLAGMSPSSAGWAAALKDVQDKQKAVNDLQDQMKGKAEETTKAVEKIPTALERLKTGVSSVSDLVEAMDSLKNIGDDLASVFKGEKDAWESLMTVFKSGVSIMQTVISVMEAINTLQEISATLKKANAVASEAETTAAVTGATTQAAAQGTVAAANMTTAGTAAAASSAEAGEAVAGIPIVGPILAVAAIAAVLAATFAAMSKAKSAGKFAEGGVVGGNSYSGDRLMAYVNSGETILTPSQADKAMAGIQGNPMQNLQLSTEISGTNLRIVLNNDNRSRGGSRGYYSNIH